MDFNSIQMEHKNKLFELTQKCKQELLNEQKQYEKKLEEYQQERDTRRKLNE